MEGNKERGNLGKIKESWGSVVKREVIGRGSKGKRGVEEYGKCGEVNGGKVGQVRGNE